MNGYKKIIAMSGALLVLFFIFYLLKSPFIVQKKNDELIVGTNVGYPPFVFRDQHGNVVGLDVDLVTQIAKKLGKKLVLKDMAFDALLVALKQGKVDMIVGGISITPQREREISMIPYYGQGIQVLSLLFWGKAPRDISSLEDLKKYTLRPQVVTQSGSIFEEYLNKNSNIVSVKVLGDIDEVIMDVRYGKSTAALLETDVALALQHSHKDIDVVTFSIEEPLGGTAVGISKNNKKLVTQVKQIIENFKKTDLLDILVKTWFFGEKNV